MFIVNVFSGFYVVLELVEVGEELGGDVLVILLF